MMAVCSLLLSTLLAFAYAPFQDRVDGVAMPTRWNDASVVWRLNPTVGLNVDLTGGPDVATAVANAFGIWSQAALNGVVVSTFTVNRGPDTAKTDPDILDCVNVISFSPSSGVSFSTGTIAFTQIATVTPVAGQTGPPFNYDVCGGITSNLRSVIFDADMMFSPEQPYSTSTPPLPNHFDVQSVASHEFGHTLGLDHNGIAHAMMFPFGDVGASQQRELAVDDIAGVAFLYPAWAFGNATGIISGQVSLDGSGVFASHVVAVDSGTGVAVMDGLTAPDGSYRLIGVPPGTYNVLALPLGGVFTLDNFEGWACGYATDPATCAGIPDNPANHTGTFF